MQYAIIIDNIIDNIAESEEALAENWEPLPEGAGRGWVRSGPGQPFESPAQGPAPVPASCQRRQGRLALLMQGLLDTVESHIAAITDPVEQRAAQIEYEADTWDRKNALLQQMWTQLGGTSESLDDMFRLAVTL